MAHVSMGENFWDPRPFPVSYVANELQVLINNICLLMSMRDVVGSRRVSEYSLVHSAVPYVLGGELGLGLE